MSTTRILYDPTTTRRSLLERAAAVIVHRRRVVCVLWLLITVAGIILAGTIAGRLTSAEHLTGLPSYRAGLAIEHQYGTGGNDDVVVTAVTLPAGQSVTSPAGRAQVTEALSPLAADHVRVAAWPAVADPKLSSPDGRTALAEIFTAGNGSSAARIGDQVRAHAPPGAMVAATDLAALEQGGNSGGLGVAGETLIGAVGALIVLVLIFGASLAVVPLAVAISSIMATFLGLGVLTTFTPVSQLVEYLVSLIGLGIAIDYSLLITNRGGRSGRRAQPTKPRSSRPWAPPGGPSCSPGPPSPSACPLSPPCPSPSSAAWATAAS